MSRHTSSSSSSISSSSSSPNTLSLDTATTTSTHHRRSSSSSTSGGSGSPVRFSSPLSLPPASAAAYLDTISEDGMSDDASSPPEQMLLTPNESAPGTPKMSAMVSEHAMLASLSCMPTPTLPGVDDDTPLHNGQHTLEPPKMASAMAHRSATLPLLPPHHPLRKQMYASFEREGVSPPHTPKGHPLEPTKLYFPFSSKSKTHPITNPYTTLRSNYTSTVSYFFRIPRRFRPVLLLAICSLIFCLSYLQRSARMEQLVRQGHTIYQRRYVEVDAQGLDGVSEAHETAQWAADALSAAGERARSQESAIQSFVSGHAPVEVESIKFETPEEELAAIISFVTSTTSNAFPTTIDPSVPLDPSFVLDFDPSREGAKEDLDLLVTEINTIYPLVLLGKMRDPWHREIKKMLAEYKITPAPLVIDVDQRKDHAIFVPLLARVLDTPELPQLLLKGKSLGSYHDVLNLRDAGTLRTTLEESGSISVREHKKKKKGVKERERFENERILGPAPILDE